jgi:hypothetical protein
MSAYKRAIARLGAAEGPPRTEEEWEQFRRDMIVLATQMFLDCGAPSKAEARRMAEIIHGGVGGRLLAQMSFDLAEQTEASGEE